MQTASVPCSAWQVSTRSSPKKWDFPEPLPPYAPLYRAGCSKGSKTLAVGILRVDNDALDSLDLFDGPVVTNLEWLSLAPAAVENGVRRGNAGGRRRILALHDFDEDSDCCLGVAPRQRADRREHFWHSGVAAFRHDIFARRRIEI